MLSDEDKTVMEYHNDLKVLFDYKQHLHFFHSYLATLSPQQHQQQYLNFNNLLHFKVSSINDLPSSIKCGKN